MIRHGNWATVAGRSAQGPARNGGNGVQLQAAEEARRGAAAMMQERRDRANRMKKEFNQTLEIEKHRRMAGRNETNYVMLLSTTNNKVFDQDQVAEMLEEVGLKDKDIYGIASDPFRQSQLEVILNKDVVIDIESINRKIVEKKFNFEANLFGHHLETFTMKGLPLTVEIESIKAMIKEAIKPYVAEVHSISPSMWHVPNDNRTERTKRYFEGKCDGTYRVHVVPKLGMAVPNFVAVGPEFALGQVNYVKGGVDFQQQCNNCYGTGHLKSDPACPGVSSWITYARKQREESRRIMEAAGETVIHTTQEILEDRLKKLELEAAEKVLLMEEEVTKNKELEKEREDVRKEAEERLKEQRENIEKINNDLEVNRSRVTDLENAF